MAALRSLWRTSRRLPRRSTFTLPPGMSSAHQTSQGALLLEDLLLFVFSESSQLSNSQLDFRLEKLSSFIHFRERLCISSIERAASIATPQRSSDGWSPNPLTIPQRIALQTFVLSYLLIRMVRSVCGIRLSASTDSLPKRRHLPIFLRNRLHRVRMEIF